MTDRRCICYTDLKTPGHLQSIRASSIAQYRFVLGHFICVPPQKQTTTRPGLEAAIRLAVVVICWR